jgi:hypothetical protein
VIHAGVRAAFLLLFLAAWPGTVRAQEPEPRRPPVEEPSPEEAEEEAEEDVREEAEPDEFLDALTAREAADMTPPEVAEGDTMPGVQGGEAEFRIRVPGTTEILVRGDDTPEGGVRPPEGGVPPPEGGLPPPEEEEPPPEELPPPEEEEFPPPGDPGDAPTPTPYGEELCPVGKVQGQFEPVQGVWQDDPTFPDKPGKQIVKLSAVAYRAELPMVTGRQSLLFGIQRAVGGSEPRRDEIFIKGEASGSAMVPVKFRFTLKQAGSQSILYESAVVGEVPLGGDCGGVRPFEVSLDATRGIPPDTPFTIDADGEYILEAELVTGDGRPTGIKVAVLGRSVTTHAPKLAFRLVTMLRSGQEEPFHSQLVKRTKDLASDVSRAIPDYFPLRNERLKTRVFPPRDRSDLLDVLSRQPRLSQLRAADGGEMYFEEAVREEMIREAQVGGLMSGFDRIVVLLPGGDFRLMWHGSFHQDAEIDATAFASSQKVVFLDTNGADHFVVAHEIIHTLPFSFSSPQMLAECDIDYHGLKPYRVGHGHQITLAGGPFRSRMDNSLAVMTSGPKKWISQCSYRHILAVLSAGIPDPRVLLVQGFVARSEAGTEGFFMPFYDLDGFVDLPPDGKGDWAVVLRDGGGNVLARHAWEPQWQLPDIEVERTLVAFGFRVPWVEGIARIDLEGPDGLLDSRILSPTAPEVAITSPAEGTTAPVENGAVRVEWSGTDADGDALLYTILYSPDAGETWMDVAVETAESSVLVPIDPEAPPDAHRVLVHATDGGRSSDAMRTLHPATEGQ